jgi:hypothetical protein
MILFWQPSVEVRSCQFKLYVKLAFQAATHDDCALGGEARAPQAR